MSQRAANDPREPIGPWSRCPRGEFERLGRKLRTRRQRRVFLRTAGACVVAATGGGMAWWLRASVDMSFGGIACSDVHRLKDAYAKNELEESVREQVRQHIVQCPRCGPWAKSIGLKT